MPYGIGGINFSAVFGDNSKVDVGIFYYPDQVAVVITEDDKRIFHDYANSELKMPLLMEEVKQILAELFSRHGTVIRYYASTRYLIMDCIQCKDANNYFMRAVLYSLDSIHFD
jgi:hypothetical protein